jgi:ribosomal protein S18 acetylase RimI-like enzyme
MTQVPLIKATPWDTAAFGIPTWELLEYSTDALQQATRTVGHHTIKVDPLADKRLLHEYGFYYCDTLIEPYCHAEHFVAFDAVSVGISHDVRWEPLLAVCHGAFSHGRFHRDFNLPKLQADVRYDNWLAELYDAGKVFGLLFQSELAGFIAVVDNRLALHALDKSVRRRGLAKFLWTPVCRMLFEQGYNELVSSVSASNMAVLSLYASLGFRFRNALDVYHRLTE